MKFKDMPYERIDFEKAREELTGLIKALQEAKSGEEQFEIHKKYYALTDRVTTQATLCSIRHSIDTTDQFYQEEQDYYDRETPAYSNLCIALTGKHRLILISVSLIRKNFSPLLTGGCWKKRSDLWPLKILRSP